MKENIFKKFFRYLGRGIRNVVRGFFFSNGKFQPIYFWATVFLSLTALTIIFRLIAKMDAKLDISDTLIISMMGFVISLITIYTWFDKKFPSRWDGTNRRGRNIINSIEQELNNKTESVSEDIPEPPVK